MTEADYTDMAQAEGLQGWRASLTPMSSGGYAAAIWSPDFNPLAGTGRLVAARSRDKADAFAKALEKARGCLDHPQQQEKLH